MGATCSRRSKTSLSNVGVSRSGNFSEDDIKEASPGTIREEQTVARSLSRLGHRILLADNSGRRPEEGYDIKDTTMGVGGFGVVRLGKSRMSGRLSAIKMVKKVSEKSIAALRNEVAINLEMDHPHIVKLLDVFECEETAHLALELCSGGEVLDVIVDKGKFGERDTAVLTYQLLEAVRYMHARGVCHRDLKLENLLLVEKDVPIWENTLKLIDFGLSKRFTPGTREMTTRAGSALYVAPEVLASTPYNEVCDIWSCGVILFVMLSGSPPFQGETNAQILKQVLAGGPAFPVKRWQRVSAGARHLAEELFKRDPAQRATAERALQDEWLGTARRNGGSEAEKSSGGVEEHPSAFFENLRHFGKLNRFTKAAKHIVAHRMNQHEVRSLRKVFDEMDTNGDGMLSLDELRRGCAEGGLARQGVPQEELLQEVFQQVDTDGSGLIDYTEFIAAAMDARLFNREDLCHEAFEVFDQDHNGEITVDELRDVLAHDGPAASGLGRENLREILRKVDANGDQKIDFQEFVGMLSTDS